MEPATDTNEITNEKGRNNKCVNKAKNLSSCIVSVEAKNKENDLKTFTPIEIKEEPFSLEIKEEPVSPGPLIKDCFPTACVVTKVKQKIKRVKLQNKEIRNKNICQENELRNYELRLTQHLKEINSLKNETISFKEALENAKHAQCILEIQINKREAELKQLKEVVQKQIRTEEEFVNTNKQLQNENRKLKKIGREVLRMTKSLEAKISLIKNKRCQMKIAQSTLFQLGKILKEDYDKLTIKQKKYIDAVNEEYLSDIEDDKITNDVQDEMNTELLLNTGQSVEFPRPNVSDSVIDKCTYLNTSSEENTSILSNEAEIVTCDNRTNNNINIDVFENIHDNLSDGISEKTRSQKCISLQDSTLFTKDITNESPVRFINVNRSKVGNALSYQDCNIFFDAEALVSQKAQENNDLLYPFVNVKEESVSSDSDTEIFPSTVSASKIVQKIQKLQLENKDLKAMNMKQESELRNCELRLSNRLTELFDVKYERDKYKELLDNAEEEQYKLEIRFGEKEAELKQFQELVQRCDRNEEDISNLNRQMQNKKAEVIRAEHELIKVTNVFKTKSMILSKIKSKERKTLNALLQCGKILENKGVQITSQQKEYLKIIQDMMHLKEACLTGKEVDVKNDKFDDLDSDEPLIIDEFSIKQKLKCISHIDKDSNYKKHKKAKHDYDSSANSSSSALSVL